MNIKNVSADTWARLIFAVITVVNILLGILGYTELDIDENTVYTIVSFVALAVSVGRSFWKNNSFTDAAQKADEVLEEMKNIDG